MSASGGVLKHARCFWGILFKDNHSLLPAFLQAEYQMFSWQFLVCNAPPRGYTAFGHRNHVELIGKMRLWICGMRILSAESLGPHSWIVWKQNPDKPNRFGCKNKILGKWHLWILWMQYCLESYHDIILHPGETSTWCPGKAERKPVEPLEAKC